MKPSAFSRGGADAVVDLGTCTTRIATRGEQDVQVMPSAVAWTEGPRGRQVVAVGQEAADMVGRTPPKTRVVQPIRGAAIHDYEGAELLLAHALRQALGRGLVGPRLVVCVPHGIDEGSRRAVAESFRSAGARHITLVSSVLASALGAELPVEEPLGSALMDLGGGHSEAAIVVLGGVACHESAPHGGLSLDQALGAWMRDHLGLAVAPASLDNLKRQVGCHLDDPTAARGLPVRGRDLGTGQWTEVEVDERDVIRALRPPLVTLGRVLLASLKRATPELSADVVQRGVVLCGGASTLRGLARVLGDLVDLPVVVADQPELAAVRGASLLLEDPERLERLNL